MVSISVHIKRRRSVWGHMNYLLSSYTAWDEQNYFFPILFFYALFGMLLKGMVENFLLLKNEPLTPNIDGVIAL